MFRSVRMLVVIVVAAAAMLLGSVQFAFADPGLPTIPRHRHYIDTPGSDENVEVGPRVCENPDLQGAFNQFHSNLHIAVPGSPGPDQSAPGLHNDVGGEITAIPGCP